MKKIIAIIIIISIGLIFAMGIFNHFTNKDGSSRITNEEAEKDNQDRYITIINETDQIINEVHIKADNTEIESCYQKNPDEQSFSIKIPKEFNEYDNFSIILIDRYGIKYQKTISNVPITGRIEVVINRSNYIKQEGDWKKKINRFFNRD